VVWSWYDLHLGQPAPFPSPADAGYLCAVPLAVAGALAFPASVRQGASRVASGVDGLIIACGLLAISWVTVLHTVYQAGGNGPFAQLLSTTRQAKAPALGLRWA
jgi:diguanylate cyclase